MNMNIVRTHSIDHKVPELFGDVGGFDREDNRVVFWYFEDAMRGVTIHNIPK